MQKTASKRHRWYIAANLFFVFLLIGHLVSFTNNLRKVNTETQIHEFLVSTDGAKRKVRDYMETSSRTLRDWKKFIGLNDWTAEEIPRKLDDLISSADITAQVLLTDTLRGYSSAAPAGKPGEYGMEYSNTYFSIFQTLTRFRESGRPDDVIITSSFTNPINAETSIAFVTQIETRDESGAAASAFLRYVEPLRALQEVWTAFSEKENAQMSMINTMGDYTYRASMLKNENFYEYLISYNDLTYPQVEALRDTIRMAEEPGWIEYLNSKGQETLHAYSTDSQWGWTLIASIEMKELQGASVQWTILIVSGFTFGMLYLVNSAYFRSLNRQLRSSLTQLEAANSAKTRFLSSMSHDIRTPMNAILGMTAIAEKQLNDRERLEDCLHKIDLAGSHLLTLVNDILDISQIESGRLTFRPSVFSLEESAADLVNLLYHQAEDKHLRAEVHILDAHQNYLYADKGRLNQIWINLLSNAIKYTPDGGRVDIYLDEKDIPGQPEQVRLTFQVKDTGVGMSQEFQKVLFDSFTRGKDSRIDTIQGSGLGMAITKQLVDLLGGTIQVDGQEGEGSAFTVILDLDRAPAPENEGRLDGERILLVGERDLLSAVMQSITRLGGWTDCAPDGERAAGILRAQADAGTPCSLVILDRPMEDRACLEAARAIRRAMGPAGPPMVLSAFDVGDIEEDIRETGIRGVVPRPLFRTALTQALDRARHPAESETAPAGPMTDSERLRGVSILVAEDNEINWEIVQELLVMYGARTDLAENGAECVEMAEHAAPGTWQVVLMDMQMPVMGGHGGGQGLHSELGPQGQRLCGQSGPAGGKRAVHAHRPGELLERLPGAPGGGLHPHPGLHRQHLCQPDEQRLELPSGEPAGRSGGPGPGDEGSGSFFDPEYETMLELKAKGYVDLDVSNAIPDVYEGSILAFFEGDVPFLAFNSEGFSGMAKRESKSEHFSAQPFDYACAVIPVSGEEAAISAGFLPGLALVEGSANQDGGAEFLRFLCQKSELDKMAAVKGVPAVTRDSAGDARFAQLDTVPAARRVNQDISSDHSWVDECMQRCLDGILRGTLEDVEAARAHYERSIRHET